MRDLNELQRLAEQGHDESQFMLGFMYSRGQGVVRDINMARVWLERAAIANNPKAQYYLGELYSELGRTDPRAAFGQMAYWWSKSANHPYWETTEGLDGRAISMRRLVWLHMHSGFEKASPEDALRLLEELTNKYSSPRSAIELGVVYAAGSFMPLTKKLGSTPIQSDKDKGFRLIERGVLIIENGNNDIDYNLYNVIADLYLSRDGDQPRTAESLQKGLHFKKKALERTSGVNEGFALNLQNEITAFERELNYATPTTATAPTETTKIAAPSNELAAKFKKFHEYFDGLEMEQKRQFIKDLDQKLQVSPNPEYNEFLLECVAKYSAANRELKGRNPAENTLVVTGNRGMAQPFANSETAPHGADIPLQQSNQHGFDTNQTAFSHNNEQNRPHPSVNNSDSVSYTDRIHSFGASGAFMFGALLFTIGSLMLPASLGLTIDHAYGFLAFGAVLFVILPIIAFWMIYSASKSPRAPEKSLTALTLFRVTAFIHLGVIAAVAAGLALRFGGDGQALFGLSIFDSPLDLVMILAGLAVIVLYVTFYYGSLFSVIKGLRDSMYSNVFEPLPGIGPFSVINYIINVLIILGSVLIIMTGITPIYIVAIPEVVTDWFQNANFAMALVAFSLILSSAGALLCTNVLNQFNAGLGEEEFT